MSNIAVRKENGNVQPQQQTVREWEPGRMIRQFFGWDPFSEMTPFVTDERYAFAPAFEVKETKDGYEFKADMPGVKQEDLDVNITGNRLTIAGKREAEKREQTDRYYTFERSYGSFTRAFTLPDGVDTAAIHADLRDGVLTLAVPKKPEVQPKRIQVKTPPAPPKG
jgi:HSP20 family protein